MSRTVPRSASRDHGRCRYPGCESRRVDLHHIRHWSNGGPTSLDNLLSLCRQHHTAVHDRGCLIATRPGGTFTFYAPDGTEIPASPALPAPDGSIADAHDADITPDTIIPPWYGERLDLDYAIYTCLANEQVRRDRATARADQKGDGAARSRVAVFKPGKWYDVIRAYHAEKSGNRELAHISLPDWLDRRARLADSPASAA
jgi:hypothetical protein